MYIGAYHEPWADEAQSWLIARDATISEIIFDVARYEGTPALWQIILKFFINLSFPYEYFYLISIFFSSIGVGIIVFKLKIPNIYKILLPFTYFIFYEYTIKARSYCLLLPVLAGIAYIYENRKSHVFLYNFLIGILSTISLHGSIISGILYLFQIGEIFKSIKEGKNIKEYYKELISVIILSLLYMFILISVFPPADLYVNIAIGNVSDEQTLTVFVYWFIQCLQAFVLNYELTNFNFILSTIFFVLLIFAILIKNKNKKLFLSIFLSVFVFMCFVRLVTHHIGLIFYIFMFALYLVKNDIYEKNKKLLNMLITIMLVIQIFWLYNTFILERKSTYCAGKDVVEYIKTYDYEELDIYALGYYATSILPYFENNIFDNDRGGHSYYTWSSNNIDWYRFSSKEYIERENTEKVPDIIMLHNNYIDKGDYEVLIEKIRNSKKYKEKFFEGKAIFKGNLINNEGFYVFERID